MLGGPAVYEGGGRDMILFNRYREMASSEESSDREKWDKRKDNDFFFFRTASFSM